MSKRKSVLDLCSSEEGSPKKSRTWDSDEALACDADEALARRLAAEEETLGAACDGDEAMARLLAAEDSSPLFEGRQGDERESDEAMARRLAAEEVLEAEEQTPSLDVERKVERDAAAEPVPAILSE